VASGRVLWMFRARSTMPVVWTTVIWIAASAAIARILLSIVCLVPLSCNDKDAVLGAVQRAERQLRMQLDAVKPALLQQGAQVLRRVVSLEMTLLHARPAVLVPDALKDIEVVGAQRAVKVHLPDAVDVLVLAHIALPVHGVKFLPGVDVKHKNAVRLQEQGDAPEGLAQDRGVCHIVYAVQAAQ